MPAATMGFGPLLERASNLPFRAIAVGKTTASTYDPKV
jgi:hypothetical protein